MSKQYWMGLALVCTLGLIGCNSGSKNPVKEAKAELNTKDKEQDEKIKEAEKTIAESKENKEEIAEAKKKVDAFNGEVAAIDAKIAAKKKEIDDAATPAAKGPLQAELEGLQAEKKAITDQIDKIKNNAGGK